MYKFYTTLPCSFNFLPMKLTVVLFIVSIMQAAAASSYAQTVSLKRNNVPMKEIFTAIERQTGYNFVISSVLLREALPVSVDFKNASLTQALDQCFLAQPFKYTINGKTIVVSRKVTSTIKPQQQRQVTGRIINEEGTPLTHVNIKTKDGSASTTSNKDGQYKIAVPNQSTILVFSHLGYTTLEKDISVSNVLNVRMQSIDLGIKEVVVTALGIEREKKALGYAVQQIGGSEVQDVATDNWINALNGKVPGMMLNTADGPMGSSDIILRGDKSLSLGSSGALIVVDGVIISNAISGNDGAAYESSESPVDFGSTMSDINPEDIASINVLKGPGATALYGARGANGAIIITTKSGTERDGLGITFSSDVRLQQVNRWPDYQNEYGSGAHSSNGYYSYHDSDDGIGVTSVSDYGPRLNTGVKYYQYDPVTKTQSAERVPWISYPNNRKDFFRTGLTYTNNLAIEGGNKTTKARLGFSNLQNQYILLNTGYQRTAVSMSLDHQLSNKIKLGAKVNYNNKSSDNLPSSGYDNNTITFFIMAMSPNMNSEWFRDYWTVKDQRQNRPYTTTLENPYFALYEQLNPMSRNGVFGNINFAYTITPELTLTAKTGVDSYQDVSSSRQPISSRRFVNGFYKEQNIIRYEMNSDFLLSYNKSFNSDFKFGASVGGNRMSSAYNRTRAYINQLVIPGEYTLVNGVDRPFFTPYRSEKRINSVYGFTNISYKDFLFLELTARNDWSSTLPENNNSYFYPSVNTSIILSDIFKWRGSAVDYAKLRLSYAEVGNDTDPYRIDDYYGASNFSSSLNNPTNKSNANLKPERTRSYEAGVEGILLRNRMGVDVAVYRTDTYNQILNVPVERASGYYNALMNAGTVRNQGIEVQTWIRPIYNSKFKWRVTLNAAANRGTILELADNIEGIAMYARAGASILGVEGGSMGDIYGLGYLRNENDEIIYEAGSPLLTTEITKQGNVIPSWKGGIVNGFQYKNWTMKVLIDGEFGHGKYSFSHSRMMVMGKLKATLPGREEGALLGEGVVANSDGTWRPNDVAVLPSVHYTMHYQRSNAETNILDASFIKLREVSIGYSIKTKQLSKLGIKQPSVSIYGRNLFIWTKWPIYDPESGTLDGGLMVRGLDIGQFPSSRTMGAKIKFSF